jgi:hypothetical protein
MSKSTTNKPANKNNTSKQASASKALKINKVGRQVKSVELEKKVLSPKMQLLIKLSLLIILAISVSLAVIFYTKYNNLKNDPTSFQQQELKSVVSKVSKLIEIPRDEKPTIATVQDESSLKNQDFFKDVENGDKVLIFTSSKKAIIYRESTNKIINVGPIDLNSKDIN